jgi:DNA replication protein DnaC
MNIIELQRSLRQLRLGGMADVLETRLRQAQAETMAPIDLISCLVSDELRRRADRLLERRRKQAGFRDPDKSLDNFDFAFNPKINRSLVFDLATAAFINKREDVLFLGPGGTGKSHLAQAIGQAAIHQRYKVMYRETHVLLDELAEAIADGTRKEYMDSVATVPLLIIDDFGMRKLPHTAAEDLLEIIMRRYERFSTLLTSNRPVEDGGKLLGDVAAVSAMLDRLLHHGHVLKYGPRSWRTKTAAQSSGTKALSQRGRCPRAPGIYRFPPEWVQRAASRRPSFRPLSGAPGRGRDEHHCPPPAQIRTSGITAYGSSLGYGRRSVRQDKDEECVGEESIVRR